MVVEHFRLADDDSLLLCTNGLTDGVQEDAIADVLASRRTQNEQCDLLLGMALANGADDTRPWSWLTTPCRSLQLS